MATLSYTILHIHANPKYGYSLSLQRILRFFSKIILITRLHGLLKNSCCYGTILLQVRRVEEDVQLTISDTGIGISPEDLPHMFERFHRSRNASEYTGNGLGLAIVKAIVESHGGHVEAQSEGIGEGSTFTVRLPLR